MESCIFSKPHPSIHHHGSSVLRDVPAKVRGPSVREDLQTYGGIRTWARYLKIEGVVGSGGSLFITEVGDGVGLTPPVE